MLYFKVIDNRNITINYIKAKSKFRAFFIALLEHGLRHNIAKIVPTTKASYYMWDGLEEDDNGYL